MSVIVCVLLAWTSHCGVFPAQVTTKWEGKKSKKKFGKGGRGKRCAYWFYGLSMLKKIKKPRKLKTLTHTHTHSQISLFWSRAVHGLSGFSRNRNRDKRKYSLLAFSHFPIMYLLTWLWGGKRGRHASLGPPWYVAQDRYRCNRQGFPSGHASCEWPSA